MKVLQHIKNLGFYPENVLDVGANKADWSRSCRTFFPRAHYSLIEPQVEMHGYLHNFSCETGSNYVLCAAGSHDGEGLLTVWKDKCGSCMLPENGYRFEDGELAEQRKVDVFTIDSLINSEKIRQPNLVKIDTQGFELEILKGFTNLSRVEIIILEVFFFEFAKGQPLFHKTVNFMNEAGFLCYDLFNFMRRPADESLGCCDVCFVNKNSLLKKSSKWN